MNAQLPAPQSQWMFLGDGKNRKEPMTVVFSAEAEIVAAADLFEKALQNEPRRHEGAERPGIFRVSLNQRVAACEFIRKEAALWNQWLREMRVKNKEGCRG